MKEVILNNGLRMPSLGIGTFLLSPLEAENSVKEALKMGYRLVDTAAAYQNERAVGRAIHESGVTREEIFVSTKLWPCDYANPRAVDETLKRLGLDYVDLLFLHQPAGDYIAGYEQLVRAHQQGKIKAIGLSNFEGKYFEEIKSQFPQAPQVMQVECHPLYPQSELRESLKGTDIKIMSWYPLGGKGMTAELLESKPIQELAEKYGKTPAQIVLRWHIEMGFIVIPGSKNVDHIRDNLALFDFGLSKEDMEKIAGICTNKRRYNRTDEALAGFVAWHPQFEEK